MSKKLKKEELENVQGLNQKFVNAKLSLADAVLQAFATWTTIQGIRAEFKKTEDELTEVYGKNAIIDLQTGEVKDPPEEEIKEENNG
jgi:hypothetical protein